jgi:hypothetical protein
MDFQPAKRREMMPSISLVLLFVLVLIFNRQVFGALHDVLAAPPRLAAYAEELLQRLQSWVETARPAAGAYRAWGVFQALIVAGCGGMVAYADYLVLKASFLLLLPEDFSRWLAVTGICLTALAGYALHAGRSRRFRVAAGFLSFLLVASLGFLAWMRAIELDEIKRGEAAVSSFDDVSAAGSLSIAGKTAPPETAPRTSAPATSSVAAEPWFRDAVLSSSLAVLYGVGEQAAAFLAVDLAGEGLLAVALIPLHALVWLPLAPLKIINASALLRIPVCVADWLASAFADCAATLKNAPPRALALYDACRGRAIRRRYEIKSLRAGLESESALLEICLAISREAREKVLRHWLEAQAEQQILLHKEVFAACHMEAREALRQEYRDFAVPYWAKIRCTFDSTASAVRSRMTQSGELQ